MTPETERKTVGEIGLPEDERLLYVQYTNYAMKLAFWADGYLFQAEEILKRNGNWRMETKQKMTIAIKRLSEVISFVDKTMEDDGFYDDIKFLGKLLDTLKDCDIDAAREIKLLSVLKNAYGKSSVYFICTHNFK